MLTSIAGNVEHGIKIKKVVLIFTGYKFTNIYIYILNILINIYYHNYILDINVQSAMKNLTQKIYVNNITNNNIQL